MSRPNAAILAGHGNPINAFLRNEFAIVSERCSYNDVRFENFRVTLSLTLPHKTRQTACDDLFCVRNYVLDHFPDAFYRINQAGVLTE